MSDSWLQYIPADPNFRPTADAAECARALLESFVPEADEVTAIFKDSIEFFDPGANWSGVQCPACGADAASWWGDAMQEAANNGFSNLFTNACCCGARVSLNELRYICPAAFGQFVLEAMNPNILDIPNMQENQLSETIGCTLRKVWLHL